jgi:transposase
MNYEFCQKQMTECDRQLNQYLEEKQKGRLTKKTGNKPQFDLRTGLFRLTGTDLTRIDSIDVTTATTVLSETGYDMSKWETENHFVSWLRLCPDNRIMARRSSGKVGCQLTTERPLL